MARVPPEPGGQLGRTEGQQSLVNGGLRGQGAGARLDAYFGAAGLGTVNGRASGSRAPSPGYLALVASEPLEAWKAWLAFHAIGDRQQLPSGFGNQSFGFFGATMSGIKQQRERWKRAISATNAALGYAVGRLYVERYFPPAEKARAEAMVAEHHGRLRRPDRPPGVDGPGHQAGGEGKAGRAQGGRRLSRPLARLFRAGGEGGRCVRQCRGAELWQLRQSLAKLDKPVDRSEWVMTPHLVNAVNLPAMNAMNFPAAILQPPYFDPHRPAVLDYGAIGAVIGHEVSHSFDDSGALFDSKGRLRNWWTPEDFKHFEASGAQLAAQYDQYRPFPDLAVNGKLTLGENIADLAGLTAAYEAYRRSQGGKPAPKAGRVHRRPAVLHQLRAELAGEGPRPGAPEPGSDGRPCPRGVPGSDGAEPGSMVFGVPREAGAGTLSQAGGEGANLVTAGLSPHGTRLKSTFRLPVPAVPGRFGSAGSGPRSGGPPPARSRVPV